MSYFDSIEEAEKAYQQVIGHSAKVAIAHQLVTAQMIGSLSGMDKYFKEVGIDTVPMTIKVEYSAVSQMVKCRLSELKYMSDSINSMRLPTTVAYDTDKLEKELDKYIGKSATRTYNSLKYGTPAEVTKSIMDMININKDSMGLDVEDKDE